MSLPFVACYYACRRQCCHPDSPTPSVSDFFRRFCGTVPVVAVPNSDPEEFDRLGDELGRRLELFLSAQLQRFNQRAPTSSKGAKKRSNVRLPVYNSFRMASRLGDVEEGLEGQYGGNEQDEY